MKYFTTFAPEMANSYFQFKQFRISQDRCAMKVGTDGTLLGAWAHGGPTILDIGTGTGVIALMMAQRFAEALVTAIDIDADACRQAEANVTASPFSERVEVRHIALQDIAPSDAHCQTDEPARYASIVCNPPFFNDSLQSPDRQRTIARHTTTLSYRQLFLSAARLLADDGELSVVIPTECRSVLDTEAVISGFFPSRVCAVFTSERKPPRRFLLAYRRSPVAVETTRLLLGSPDHHALMSPFML